MPRPKRPSPILGAASAMIDQASASLVTRNSRFRHSFEVQVEAVQPDPGQARMMFDADEIATLARTLEESGQLQPILVRRDPGERGRWLIVAGERRWRAARLNGWQTILAIEHAGDAEVASLLENLQRVDLLPVEEARAIQRLLKGKGWSQDAAAAALGMSKSEVSSVLRILTLPPDVLEAVSTSKLALPKTVLAELARIPSGPARERLISLALRGELTIRSIRAAQSAPALDARPAKQPPAGRVSPRLLARLTSNLRSLAAAGTPLPTKDRAQLRELRVEIDRLLTAA